MKVRAIVYCSIFVRNGPEFFGVVVIAYICSLPMSLKVCKARVFGAANPIKPIVCVKPTFPVEREELLFKVKESKFVSQRDSLTFHVSLPDLVSLGPSPCTFC